MKEMVALNKGRQIRFGVLNGIAIGRVAARKAAEVLGLSLRHVRRVVGCREEGAAALAHGNRGRKPRHTLDAGVKNKVLALFRTTYTSCNSQHFTKLPVKAKKSVFSGPQCAAF